MNFKKIGIDVAFSVSEIILRIFCSMSLLVILSIIGGLAIQGGDRLETEYPNLMDDVGGWWIIHLVFGIYVISVGAILNLTFGFSIYQVLSPILNRKIKRLFNTPNRIDALEQKIENQNSIINTPNLQKILEQIAETYQNLDNQKLPEIITNLYQDMAKMKAEIENLKTKQTDSLFQCSQCRNTFTALRPDHIFNVAMKEKCSVCDMLNMMVFKRETYTCESCGKINQIFWHHKDLHTIEENRRAEKLFFESD